MNKHKISIHILISIILCVLLLLKYIMQMTSIIYPLLSVIPGIGQEARSIGIIGGADGPTAVFLSSPFKYLFLLPVIEFIGIIYVFIVLFLCYRIIKKENMKQ